MEKKEKLLKVFVIISYLVMIFINALSFVLLFSEQTVFEIFRSYPVLLAPAVYTNCIWGVIYGLLLAFAIYQLDVFGRRKNKGKEILNNARIVFITTCLLNISWILAWQFDYLALAVMIIFTMLITLKIFGKMLSKEFFSMKEKILIRLPFSVYYGWILITTVSNILSFLYSVRWSGWGISEVHWNIIGIFIVTAAVAYHTIRNRDLAFGLTIVWAYIGMLVQHTLLRNANEVYYPSIIFTIVFGIIIVSSSTGYLLLNKKKK